MRLPLTLAFVLFAVARPAFADDAPLVTTSAGVPAAAPSATPVVLTAPATPRRPTVVIHSTRAYASPGSFEIGGALASSTGTVRVEVDRIGTTSVHGSDFALVPEVGYFSRAGLEWLLQIAAFRSTKKFPGQTTSTSNGAALSLGGAYLLRAPAGIRVGPEVTAGFEGRDTRANTVDGVVKIVRQGICGTAGVRAKLALTRGLVLSAGAAYYGETFALDVGAGLERRSGSGTDQGVRVAGGAAYYF